jgi:hypothetical protein
MPGNTGFVTVAREGPNSHGKPLDNWNPRNGSALLKSLSLLCGFSLLGFALIQLVFSWLS